MGAGEKLKDFDVDNRYGKEALDQLMADVRTLGATRLEGVDEPATNSEWYQGVRENMTAVGLDWFSKDKKTGKRNELPFNSRCGDHSTQFYHPTVGGCSKCIRALNIPVSRFLNRILGLRLELQNELFKYFETTYDVILRNHKAEGTFESPMVDIKGESIVMHNGYPQVLHTDTLSGAKTWVSKLRVNQSWPWDKAFEAMRTAVAEEAAAPAGKFADTPSETGFWISDRFSAGTGRPEILLACRRPLKRSGGRVDSQQFLRLSKPNRKGQPQQTSKQLRENWTFASRADAELAVRPCALDKWGGTVKELWDFWYDFYQGDACGHGADCKARKENGHCHFNQSIRDQLIVHGAVLPVWKAIADITSVERVFFKRDKDGNNVQLIEPVEAARAELDDGTRVVGLALNPKEVGLLTEKLAPKSKLAPAQWRHRAVAAGPWVVFDAPTCAALERQWADGLKRLSVDAKGRYIDASNFKAFWLCTAAGVKAAASRVAADGTVVGTK